MLPSSIYIYLPAPTLFLPSLPHNTTTQMAENSYGIRSTSQFPPKSFLSSDNPILPLHYHTLLSSTNFRDRIPVFGSHDLVSTTSAISQPQPPSTTPDFPLPEDALTLTKAKILSHPTYPRLLQAYIDCQKVIQTLYFFDFLPLSVSIAFPPTIHLLSLQYAFAFFIFKFTLV